MQYHPTVAASFIVDTSVMTAALRIDGASRQLCWLL